MSESITTTSRSEQEQSRKTRFEGKMGKKKMSMNGSSLVILMEIVGLLCLSSILFCDASRGTIRLYDGRPGGKSNSTGKHFVLVHGAAHGAWIWFKLGPMLEAAGHKVTTMDMSASGIDIQPIEAICSADQYTQPLLSFFETLSDEEKVVLVGDSMGGINAAIAMDAYPNKIAVTVFLNAFMPDTTHPPSYVIEMYSKIYNNWEDSLSSWYLCGQKNLSTVKLGSHFIDTNLYQLGSNEDRALAKKLLRPGSFFEADLKARKWFTNESYGSIPRTFIISKYDRAIPPEFMLWEIENFGVDKYYEVEGDHLLAVTNPAAALGPLLEAAEEYA
ncbi:alpha-hydroxynitrile lyase-like [Malania oleifera]|uniref:alpha-hydroxynitrile lyase-like n=1 Tax=Malania oleifera TaxID=397392 RepID=UPI0025AE8493|nr:alpha-hydroxynitrile lyase-like [Malania oleifera]